jgi:hypothetical protein
MGVFMGYERLLSENSTKKTSRLARGFRLFALISMGEDS